MWNRNSRWKWVDSRGFIGRILNDGANREDFYRGGKRYFCSGENLYDSLIGRDLWKGFLTVDEGFIGREDGLCASLDAASCSDSGSHAPHWSVVGKRKADECEQIKACHPDLSFYLHVN